jgi:hypothetical protein
MLKLYRNYKLYQNKKTDYKRRKKEYVVGISLDRFQKKVLTYK